MNFLKAIAWLLAIPLVFFGIALFIFGAAVYDGYVLQKLWEWYVTPQFGLAELSLKVATGLALIVGMLSYQFVYSRRGTAKEEKQEYLRSSLSFIAFTPVVFLLTGYMVQQFM